MAQAVAAPPPYRPRSSGAGADHVTPRVYRTAPAPQQVPVQSDAVDARDLARRLEIYSIELQLRAQSRPGRSPSPPPRKKPPPDTPSTASSQEYSATTTPGRPRHSSSRANSAWPEGPTVNGVQAQRVQAKRASTIEVKPTRGTRARPQSLHPDYVNAQLVHQPTSLASKRQSRYMSGISIVPVADDLPALPAAQLEGLGWQPPKTTEEAAKVLAALAQHETARLEQNGLTPSRSRPKTASSLGQDSSGAPSIAHTPQQAAVDLVSATGPGAVKAVHVRRPTLSVEPNGVSTREASFHSGGGNQNKATTPPSQAEAPSKTPERPRASAQAATNSRPTSSHSPGRRKSTASSFDKRKSGISVRNIELSVPSIPNSPLPSPGAPSPRSGGFPTPQRKSAVFDEAAFIAMARKPSDHAAAKEADRRSRGVSTSMSTVNHRLSASSLHAFGLPAAVPDQTLLNHVAQPTESKSLQDPRKEKQKAMRSKAIKETGGGKSLVADGKRRQAPPDAPNDNVAPHRAASTAAVAASPGTSKKAWKSPGNSRPPSRAATVASVKSRSRAASQVTSPLSISAIEQIRSTPLPQTGLPMQSAPKTQSSPSAAPPPGPATSQQTKQFQFPELAPDPAATKQQAASLAYSKSLSNFSRPGGHPGEKQSIPLTMPAPPDAVYNTTARHRANSSVASHTAQGVRAFQNGGGKKYDQTEGMTGGSLALLQRMEAEMVRREGASRAGSRIGHSRVASRTSVMLGVGRTTEDISALPAAKGKGEDFDDGTNSSRSKRKKRGCMGCLG